MKLRNTFLIWIVVIAVVAIPAFSQDGRGQAPAQGQGGQGRGQGGGRGGPGAGPAAVLPTSPTAVALPKISGPVTGPGPIYESVQSLAPGRNLTTYKYEAKEYFIEGTANGQLANHLRPLGEGLASLIRTLGKNLDDTLIVVAPVRALQEVGVR